MPSFKLPFRNGIQASAHDFGYNGRCVQNKAKDVLSRLLCCQVSRKNTKASTKVTVYSGKARCRHRLAYRILFLIITQQTQYRTAEYRKDDDADRNQQCQFQSFHHERHIRWCEDCSDRFPSFHHLRNIRQVDDNRVIVFQFLLVFPRKCCKREA